QEGQREGPQQRSADTFDHLTDRPEAIPTACLVVGAGARRQRIIAPARNLQKIPEPLQTSLPATAQPPCTVLIATPATGHPPCLSPHALPMTDGGCATARRSRQSSFPSISREALRP